MFYRNFRDKSENFQFKIFSCFDVVATNSLGVGEDIVGGWSLAL